MRYLSLFTGIGGFEVAIDRVLPGSTCVGFSEIEPHALEVYQHHFPGHLALGDVTAVRSQDIPQHDLLVAGFPCQPFSTAGKRQGFEDVRGTLFYEIARILESHRPQHFILENVKGLIGHDSGRTFRTIIRVLDELGYFVEWQVLNSKDFGVPHSRERTYIVGHFGGEPAARVLPFPRASGLNLREITQGVADAFRIYEPTISRTLKAMGGGLGALTGLYWDGKGFRVLTPVETERLQGFPDGWTFGSDIARKRRCGNAVTVPVVEAILGRMYLSEGVGPCCGLRLR